MLEQVVESVFSSSTAFDVSLSPGLFSWRKRVIRNTYCQSICSLGFPFDLLQRFFLGLIRLQGRCCVDARSSESCCQSQNTAYAPSNRFPLNKRVVCLHEMIYLTLWKIRSQWPGVVLAFQSVQHLLCLIECSKPMAFTLLWKGKNINVLIWCYWSSWNWWTECRIQWWAKCDGEKHKIIWAGLWAIICQVHEETQRCRPDSLPPKMVICVWI